MRKFLITFGLLISLMTCGVNVGFCEDMEYLNTVNVIGSLANADKTDEALVKVNEALKKYPDQADLYYWRGVILTDQKKPMEALSDFDKAISLNPDDVTYHLTRGMCMADIGNKTGAMDEFNYVIKKEPENGLAYSMRAVIKLGMGDLTGANEDLELAKKFFETNQP